MLKLIRRLDPTESRCPHAGPLRTLVLPYAERVRSRLRVRLTDGEDAGMVLPRGTVLHDGDLLEGSDGTRTVVVAAAEAVYSVTPRRDSADPAFDLMRGAYHLGNRHIPLQLSPERLVLERDPVLRDLLLGLGLEVDEGHEPFDPEPGAYGGGHRHDHDAEGGGMGELLSRQAHGEPTRLTELRFVEDRSLPPEPANR